MRLKVAPTPRTRGAIPTEHIETMPASNSYNDALEDEDHDEYEDDAP
jgi:hypothetical protein